MTEFKINTIEDVGKFFIWLVFEKRLDFHPDDDFGEYENYETHEPTFTNEEVRYYNDVMNECFNVCEKYKRDIYVISSHVYALYYYCES